MIAWHSISLSRAELPPYHYRIQAHFGQINACRENSSVGVPSLSQFAVLLINKDELRPCPVLGSPGTRIGQTSTWYPEEQIS